MKVGVGQISKHIHRITAILSNFARANDFGEGGI